jgi:hypothetical protein
MKPRHMSKFNRHVLLIETRVLASLSVSTNASALR